MCLFLDRDLGFHYVFIFSEFSTAFDTVILSFIQQRFFSYLPVFRNASWVVSQRGICKRGLLSRTLSWELPGWSWMPTSEMASPKASFIISREKSPFQTHLILKSNAWKKPNKCCSISTLLLSRLWFISLISLWTLSGSHECELLIPNFAA